MATYPEYSEPLKFGRYTFRYNYKSEKLECLKRKIKIITVHDMKTPTVYDDVTFSINLKVSCWEKCPGYWVELYDSIIEKTEDTGRKSGCIEGI